MTSTKGKNLAQKNQAEQYPRNATETKQRIFEAAKTLFSRDVYSKVGTRDIAAEAGVNLTLINRYFGSKKKLFAEVVMSLGGGDTSPGTPKERALAAIMDFLSDEENQRKEELRLILFSAIDSDVSDVISDFFMQLRKAEAQSIQGENKETKAVLSFSLIAGIALTSLLFHTKDRKNLDMVYMEKYLSRMLDELYYDEEHTIEKSD